MTQITTDDTSRTDSLSAAVSRRRLLLALPAVGFAGLAAVFAWSVSRDPSQLPSALIGKTVPAFDLPPVAGRTLGVASKDLYGEVSLVNVFASWCVACRGEHPLFMRLAERRTVPIHGLNYKDRPQDAAQWLNTLGDPYTRTGADRDGRVAIDWGVYGVPETFVVGADGRIAHKHIGPVTEQALRETILPLVERLRQQAKGGTS
ncbi:DsbE family thiol:disulfide interchange protein [Rhizobium sp. 9140]|uniref:DsbE family thiol:disulfide interchange protein n=1 Tax=Rhizobium sp. 9140 TaxID=1761900 RepID=UPI00079234BE|nr:DsbE family thiol:disulfide interchange protein [Rhizobium sp. 9140]CZT37764.1 cytochrome c biogenesis protein CcmG, thiol:disulfide interchange protein DsbE [Rhizobium sp. 9140]